MQSMAEDYDQHINRFPDNPDYDKAECLRCGVKGLILTKVGQRWALFEHVGLRLREHECDHSSAFD